MTGRLAEIWPEDRLQPVESEGPQVVPTPKEFETLVLLLSPQNDAQRWLQGQALKVGAEIMETRWLVLGGQGGSVPLPFLVVVVFWLTIIFGSFGLSAPRNATVIGVLLLCALSVAGAIFLILEMDQPFRGLMKVSGAPLRYALSQLGH